MSELNAISAFMRAVVPWPGSASDPGYVNLHYTLPPDPKFKGKDKTFMPGWAKRDVDSFVQAVHFAGARPKTFKGLWYCLSLQGKTKLNKKGQTIADRKTENALALKAIWVDVDIKHYPDASTCLKDMLAFIAKMGLPSPTIVNSGGGFHFYWINKKTMLPDEWRTFASGLKQYLIDEGVKADYGITTDIARVLRMPGTLNQKPEYPAPIEVKLITPTYEYDFNTPAFQKLANHAPPLPAAKPSHSIFAEGADMESFKVKPFWNDQFKDEADLNAGINTNLVDPTPIFKQCGFYRDALKNGGKDYGQELWMYSILGATFMEKGDVIAHEISKGHKDYSPSDTDEMFSRKVADRDNLGLGYPSCATIKGAGCKACEGCPLLGKIKSPLNIRPQVTATVTDTSQSNPPNQASWTGKLGVSLKNIPHRKWLYGVDLVRGELTVIASPGGAGKSSLAIGMAICIATNRELLGEKIRGGSNLKAVVINGEDSTDEIRRRVYAFSLQHGLAESDLSRLTVVGASDLWVQRISFLTTNGDKSALNQGGLDALQLALEALKPDVIVLDPLVSFCAGGNINDNAVMSLVMRKLKEIAARYECAVLIVHHTRKGGDAGNVEAVSGAAAITNLSRRAIMPVTPAGGRDQKARNSSF